MKVFLILLLGISVAAGFDFNGLR
ncbi:jg27726, partial [Pararge aegeria aegeria]